MSDKQEGELKKRFEEMLDSGYFRDENHEGDMEDFSPESVIFSVNVILDEAAKDKDVIIKQWSDKIFHGEPYPSASMGNWDEVLWGAYKEWFKKWFGVSKP